MNEEEAIETIREIKKDNESKIMIINTNTSNIQIRWSNKDLKEMAEIRNRCAKENRAIETALNLLEKKDKEIQYQKDINKTEQDRYKQTEKSLKGQIAKKDKIIDEIQKEVSEHISFENILKRDNTELDLFNQGRFYVANNIKNILKRK